MEKKQAISLIYPTGLVTTIDYKQLHELFTGDIPIVSSYTLDRYDYTVSVDNMSNIFIIFKPKKFV